VGAAVPPATAATPRAAPPAPLLAAAPHRLARSERAPLADATADDAAHRLTGDAVAVLYPELGEPYRGIFNAIIDGIALETGPVRRYPVAAGTDVPALQATLRRHGVRVVVALGRQGLRAAQALEANLPVVVGGIVSVPAPVARERLLAGISLTPDPALLFMHLRRLQPGVRRVFVVYNPAHNDWLLSLARPAARAQGLELVALEARDVATAARHYQALFTTTDGRRDALWLPQDPTTGDEEMILPLVLREAWSHSLPVISSSFPHVKKGALFALYPDNRELGRALAKSAVRLLAGESGAQDIEPLQAVLTAINLRTASHLGLTIDYQQQRRFDFVFPEP
jgi:putative ABC transport system substrate-binding protein